MIQDVEKAIRDYLPNIVHMSFATCVNNKPWVCEVHFVFDDNLNLYFTSLKASRHGREIAQNPNVAGNIVKQYRIGENVKGVYFEGKAELLENVEVNSLVFKLFSERLGSTEQDVEDAKKEDRHKFYKITVSKYYLFDVRESKPSMKYELEWSK